MAITILSAIRSSMGNKWQISGKLSWSTYTTGGDPIQAEDISLAQIHDFEIVDNELGFMFDPEINLAQSQVNVKVFEGAGFTPAGSISNTSAGTPAGTVTPTALAAETITITDDAAAATYSRAGIVSVPDVGYQFSVCAESWPDTSAPGPLEKVTSSLGNMLLINPLGFESHKVNVENNAAPAGNNVYFRPTGYVGTNADIVGVFVSNVPGAVSSYFTLLDPTGLNPSENVSVYHDPNAANGSLAITCNSAAPDGSRISVVMPNGGASRCYVQSQHGRYIAMTVVLAAAVAPLTFDETVVDETKRLESTDAAFTNTFNPNTGILRLYDQVAGSLFAVVSGGNVTLEAEVPWYANLGMPTTTVNVRVGSRVLPVNIVAASAGTPLFYDTAIKFAANFGSGNKTLAFSTTDRPEGYQPTYTFGGVALAVHNHNFAGTPVSAGPGTQVTNGTDLAAAGLTEVEFIAVGL